MYLVSPTGEEKEKQSMKRKKKNKQAKVILLKLEASVVAIQGLRKRLPYMDHVTSIIHFSGTTQDNTMNCIPASALTLLEVLDNLSI